MSQIARILITLDDIEPVIWRRFDAPVTMNLRALHQVIQAVMGWEDRHLYEYRIGEKIYGEPPPPDLSWGRSVMQAKGLRLSALIDRAVTSLTYVYDFGDDWRHTLTIEEVRTAEPGVDYPRLVDGERAAPPEDCGGMPGYFEFVHAINDRSHPQHKELQAWSGEPYDPADIGREIINDRLKSIVERRKVSLEAFHKSQRTR